MEGQDGPDDVQAAAQRGAVGCNDVHEVIEDLRRRITGKKDSWDGVNLVLCEQLHDE